MDKETELYYRHLTDMFRSEGWKVLLEEFNSDVKALQDLDAIKTEQDLYYHKGQLYILNSLLNLEATVELMREEHD